METMNDDVENGREKDEAEEELLDFNPTHLYCLSGSLEDVIEMIEAGVDVNEREELSGDTLVHLAVRYTEAVPLVLEAGADVHCKNRYGDTPLLLAAGFNRDPKAVKLLLQAGTVNTTWSAATAATTTSPITGSTA